MVPLHKEMTFRPMKQLTFILPLLIYMPVRRQRSELSFINIFYIFFHIYRISSFPYITTWLGCDGFSKQINIATTWNLHFDKQIKTLSFIIHTHSLTILSVHIFSNAKMVLYFFDIYICILFKWMVPHNFMFKFYNM